MFENKRYITRGVSQKVDLRLQLFMWQCIDRMNVPKDYLQIFKCSMSGTKQKIEHMQEEPAYKRKREHLFLADASIYIGIGFTYVPRVLFHTLRIFFKRKERALTREKSRVRARSLFCKLLDLQ